MSDTVQLLKKIELLTKQVANIDHEVKKSKSDIRKLSSGKSHEDLESLDKTESLEKKTRDVDLEQNNVRKPKTSAALSNFDVMEEKIADERQSYAEGLTIHGLSRIATGRPFSKVIWTLLVMASLLTALLISKEHFEAYLGDHSVTHTAITAENEIAVPSITICNYDGINRERRHFSGTPPFYTRPQLVSVDMRECGNNLTKCGYDGRTIVEVLFYSSDYVKSKKLNHLVKFDDTTNCFTVSGFTQTFPSDIFSVQLVANRTGDLWSELYVNPDYETFHEASPTIYWASEGFYHVNVVKKKVTRLGLPYTECIKGSGTYTQNKFTGVYTVTKCKKGCFWEAVFEKCGAIPPMYKKHLREPHRFDNKTFVDDVTGDACLREVELDDKVTSKCNAQCTIQPCYEEDIKISLDFHRSPDLNFLEFAFTYQSFMVETIEEVPAYTWQDLFANFGGCVGLMTGASILSICELFIFFGLVCFDFFDIYSKIGSKITPKKK